MKINLIIKILLQGVLRAPKIENENPKMDLGGTKIFNLEKRCIFYCFFLIFQNIFKNFPNFFQSSFLA